jgi:hypothetical protein
MTCDVPFQYQTLSKSVKLFLRWNMRSYLIFQVCCEHTRSSKCVANIHDFPSVFRTYKILQVCCDQARSSKYAANMHDLPSVLRTGTIFQVCCEHTRSSTYAANIRDLPSVLSFYVLHAKNTWKLWRAIHASIHASIHYEIDIFPQLLSLDFSSFSFCLRRHFIHLIFCFHSLFIALHSFLFSFFSPCTCICLFLFLISSSLSCPVYFILVYSSVYHTISSIFAVALV